MTFGMVLAKRARFFQGLSSPEPVSLSQKFGVVSPAERPGEAVELLTTPDRASRNSRQFVPRAGLVAAEAIISARGWTGSTCWTRSN